MDNPERLATQGTQDEDKQTKNTTQYMYMLNTTIYAHPTHILAIVTDALRTHNHLLGRFILA